MDTPSKRIDIIPAKRYALILEWLRRHGTASIHELTADIGASQSTIRRDLEHLTETGYLQRTHGGATLLPEPAATFEIESSIIAHIARPQKQAIGLAAAALLNPRDSVIFDSSTTVMEAVRALIKGGMQLTAVTNSLEIAQLCSQAPGIRVMVPGGTVRFGSPTLVGEPGVEFLKSLHADACMIGTHAITGNLLTEAFPELAFLKRAMIQASRRRILLADSSKFQVPALFTFAELPQIDEIVTDDGVTAEQLASLRATTAKVTIVSAGMQAEAARDLAGAAG